MTFNPSTIGHASETLSITLRRLVLFPEKEYRSTRTNVIMLVAMGRPYTY